MTCWEMEDSTSPYSMYIPQPSFSFFSVIWSWSAIFVAANSLPYSLIITARTSKDNQEIAVNRKIINGPSQDWVWLMMSFSTWKPVQIVDPLPMNYIMPQFSFLKLLLEAIYLKFQDIRREDCYALLVGM